MPRAPEVPVNDAPIFKFERAGRFALFLAAAVVGAAPSAGAGGSRENEASIYAPNLPAQPGPIVNGHHVQPRPSDFNRPEFTPEQSREVDELYQEILRMREGEAWKANGVPRGGRD